MPRNLLLLCAVSAFIVDASVFHRSLFAETLTVNPADESAFSTIQLAIDQSSPSDIILVHPGHYSERIDFLGKRIVLQSSNGSDVTTIDGGGSGFVSAVTCASGEAEGTRISGFTITGGTNGGMLVRNGSDVAIENCIFMNNSSPLIGGGLSVENLGCVVVVNCLFMENEAFNGGGIGFSVSSGDVINCTLVGNTATGNPPFTGGGMFGLDSRFNLRNCILFGNHGQEPGQQAQIDTPNQFFLTTINYCCIEGWDGSLEGTGNFGADPLFVAPPTSDLRLQQGSPCNDAGDNSSVPVSVNTDLDGESRFFDDPAALDIGNGISPLVDMGAYEFQAGLALGDINGDGSVDLFDIPPFVLVLVGEPQMSQHTDRSDLNDDGVINGTDIQVMVEILLGV
ncbi:MAG: right-handed parallel beta-helix repeat-containing protein [Phycisphaerales bacterium]|nr:right-handed parallel beta-helix repeat-containing protein [Phycisphaerales bacterium]